MPQFTLPDNQNFPPQRFQLGLLPQIPLAITLEFGAPKIQARFWHSREFAVRIRVSVPKAPVHENCLPSTAEHQVRGAGEASVMKAIAEAHGVDQAPH